METLPFGAVYYWPELTRIFDKARHRVPRTLYICWGAQAALHHFHGVPKHALARKAFGVFRHDRVAESALLDGLGDGFPVPVSRHTEVRAADLPAGRGLRTLAGSAQSGLCLVQDAPGRALYMFNHLEYDTRALADEYWRDRADRTGLTLHL